MKKNFSCFQRCKSGFTLIELLIVLAVVGVLAAAAVPSMVGFVDFHETEACRDDLTQASRTFVAQWLEDGAVPSGQLENWKQHYIDSTPVDCAYADEWEIKWAGGEGGAGQVALYCPHHNTSAQLGTDVLPSPTPAPTPAPTPSSSSGATGGLQVQLTPQRSTVCLKKQPDASYSAAWNLVASAPEDCTLSWSAEGAGARAENGRVTATAPGKATVTVSAAAPDGQTAQAGAALFFYRVLPTAQAEQPTETPLALKGGETLTVRCTAQIDAGGETLQPGEAQTTLQWRLIRPESTAEPRLTLIPNTDGSCLVKADPATKAGTVTLRVESASGDSLDYTLQVSPGVSRLEIIDTALNQVVTPGEALAMLTVEKAGEGEFAALAQKVSTRRFTLAGYTADGVRVEGEVDWQVEGGCVQNTAQADGSLQLEALREGRATITAAAFGLTQTFTVQTAPLALQLGFYRQGGAFISIAPSANLTAATATVFPQFVGQLTLPETGFTPRQLGLNQAEYDALLQCGWGLEANTAGAALTPGTDANTVTLADAGEGVVTLRAVSRVDEAVRQRFSISVLPVKGEQEVSIRRIGSDGAGELASGSREGVTAPWRAVTLRADVTQQVNGQQKPLADQTVVWSGDAEAQQWLDCSVDYNTPLPQGTQPVFTLKPRYAAAGAGPKEPVQAKITVYSGDYSAQQSYTITILPQFKITVPVANRIELWRRYSSKGVSEQQCALTANRPANWTITAAGSASELYIVPADGIGQTNTSSFLVETASYTGSGQPAYRLTAQDCRTGQTDIRTLTVQYDNSDNGFFCSYDQPILYFDPYDPPVKLGVTSWFLILSDKFSVEQDADVCSVQFKKQGGFWKYTGTATITPGSQPGSAKLYNYWTALWNFQFSNHAVIVTRGVKLTAGGKSYLTELKNMDVGKTVSFSCDLFGEAMSLRTDKTTSSNPAVAVIDGTPTQTGSATGSTSWNIPVKALAPGRTVLTVVGENVDGTSYTASCTITVASPWGAASNVHHSLAGGALKASLAVDDTAGLRASFDQPSQANYTASFLSSDSSVAVVETVAGQPRVRAVGKGTAVVTAYVGETESPDKITVKVYEVEDVTLKDQESGQSNAVISISASDAEQLRTLLADVALAGPGAAPEELGEVTWELPAGQKVVEIVSQDGRSIALRAVGMGSVTVLARSVKDPTHIAAYPIIVTF